MLYAALLCLFTFTADAHPSSLENLRALPRFEKYKAQFNKVYGSVDEHRTRFHAFMENEREIRELNAINGDAVYGWTKFSDLTKTEFKKFLGYERKITLERSEEIAVAEYSDMSDLSSVDWRPKGLVTPVKNQGDCGSCWAFSATETIESAYLKANSGSDAKSFSLSPQEIVSCDYNDGGCNGGDLPSAFKFVQGAGGMASEKSYPYTSGNYGDNGSCQQFQTIAGTKPSDWKYATPACKWGSDCKNQDEGALLTGLKQKGPIGICLNASNWQNYQSGVMSADACGGGASEDLDHCVQLVGFEAQGSGGYWIVRNSWTTQWGVDGYIHLDYGTNTCGVADEALYVEL